MSSEDLKAPNKSSGTRKTYILSIYRYRYLFWQPIYVSDSNNKIGIQQHSLSDYNHLNGGGDCGWCGDWNNELLGAGSFLGNGQEQVVLSSWSTGADCGVASVVVANYENHTLTPSITVSNPCNLGASIQGGSILLHGPEYLPTDPNCCPSKPNATALLNFDGNEWVMTPKIFTAN